jgi:predicted phosphodiesterase
VLSAIVSDLHLGTASGVELGLVPAVRERLVSALEGADQVVLLGDVLELRERPVSEVLALARPLLEALGEVTAGGRVVLVPGNHDHQLAEPWLSRGHLDGGDLQLEGEWSVGPGDGLAGRVAQCMPRTELVVAYPGLRPRPDVYATHGHYLDLRLTVPRLETIAASSMARLAGRGRECRTPADHEAVLAPLYAFLYGLAQGGTVQALRKSGRLSRGLWRRANARDARRLGAFLLGRITIPGAVSVLNRSGLGPFGSDISGAELRRAGLRAMAEVVERLGIEADHVIFGHTHRAGPLDGETEGWRLPGGTRLWNSGSWLHEAALLDSADRGNPYWPGTVVRLRDEGPPELRNVLGDLTLRPARAKHPA